MQMYQLQGQQLKARTSCCSARVQWCPSPGAAHVRRQLPVLQAQPDNGSSDGSALITTGDQAVKPKRKYVRRKDPAEVSAGRKLVAQKLVEHEGEMIPIIEKARRVQAKTLVEYEGRLMTSIEKARLVRATKLVEFEGQMMTAEQMRRLKSGRKAAGGTPRTTCQPALGIPRGPWGPAFTVYAPYSSKEGGMASPYQRWMDALQLAAHELGVRPAMESVLTERSIRSPVFISTAAGKAYLVTLRPFQEYQQLAQGRPEASTKKSLAQALKASSRRIYLQMGE